MFHIYCVPSAHYSLWISTYIHEMTSHLMTAFIFPSYSYFDDYFITFHSRMLNFYQSHITSKLHSLTKNTHTKTTTYSYILDYLLELIHIWTTQLLKLEKYCFNDTYTVHTHIHKWWYCLDDFFIQFFTPCTASAPSLNRSRSDAWEPLKTVKKWWRWLSSSNKPENQVIIVHVSKIGWGPNICYITFYRQLWNKEFCIPCFVSSPHLCV